MEIMWRFRDSSEDYYLDCEYDEHVRTPALATVSSGAILPQRKDA
jgi:hypothetical protein